MEIPSSRIVPWCEISHREWPGIRGHKSKTSEGEPYARSLLDLT